MAEAELTATRVRVWSRIGSNGQAAGGWVNFSDGVSYSFGWHPIEQHYYFTTATEKRGSFSFKSPKRAAALEKALNDGSNVDASPIKVDL